MNPIMKFQIGDVLELKKPHPCGSCHFHVARVGSDVRIICNGCGRDLTIERIRLEKQTKKRTPRDDTQGDSL